MNLFQKGDFTLHSGYKTFWKIDCDALTDEDIDTLAFVVSLSLNFSKVVSVPTGGDRLAKALEKYCDGEDFGTIIVDDVLTTGKSMNEMREKYPDALGIVIFSRGPTPDWIEPLFQYLF